MNDKNKIRILVIYALFLISVFILFKNSSLIYVTNTEWLVFTLLLVGIGFLLYVRTGEINILQLKKQYKYLRYTYWIGLIILIAGVVSILFITPLFAIYGMFISIRIIIGLILFFNNTKN